MTPIKQLYQDLQSSYPTKTIFYFKIQEEVTVNDPTIYGFVTYLFKFSGSDLLKLKYLNSYESGVILLSSELIPSELVNIQELLS